MCAPPLENVLYTLSLVAARSLSRSKKCAFRAEWPSLPKWKEGRESLLPGVNAESCCARGTRLTGCLSRTCGTSVLSICSFELCLFNPDAFVLWQRLRSTYGSSNSSLMSERKVVRTSRVLEFHIMTVVGAVTYGPKSGKLLSVRRVDMAC